MARTTKLAYKRTVILLALISMGYSRRRAAQAAGIDRRTLQRWIKFRPDFAAMLKALRPSRNDPYNLAQAERDGSLQEMEEKQRRWAADLERSFRKFRFNFSEPELQFHAAGLEPNFGSFGSPKKRGGKTSRGEFRDFRDAYKKGRGKTQAKAGAEGVMEFSDFSDTRKKRGGKTPSQGQERGFLRFLQAIKKGAAKLDG